MCQHNNARAAVLETPLSLAWILRDVVQWILLLHGREWNLSLTYMSDTYIPLREDVLRNPPHLL